MPAGRVELPAPRLSRVMTCQSSGSASTTGSHIRWSSGKPCSSSAWTGAVRSPYSRTAMVTGGTTCGVTCVSVGCT